LTFSLVLWHELGDEINRLPGKIRRIIKPALEQLEEDPFPDSKGDKERLVLKGGVIIYQLHISERYTVFYEIDKEEKRVIVQEILPTGHAHKKYG
jgi:mRNA-degrading endonuclease RelE of RelBE toxin-antitoxin system